MVRISPFEELKLSHDLGSDPLALLHLLGGQRFAQRALRVSGRLTKGRLEVVKGLSFSNTRRRGTKVGGRSTPVRATPHLHGVNLPPYGKITT
jgi:hypothetical protein